MKRWIWLAVSAVLPVALAAGYTPGDDGSRYPVMRPDPDTLLRWMIEYEAAPQARIDPDIESKLYLARVLDLGTSLDLRGQIDYDAGLRDQGACANCWVWAATAVMEIAHAVQDGVSDRLSIQYFNSCHPGHACCGGSLGDFAAWYTGQGVAVPWDNTTPPFADRDRGCSSGHGVRCGDIATVPNYPLVSVRRETIATHNVAQATAIDNVKNILNQKRAVYFWFALPDAAAWQALFDFWDGVHGETEATLCGVIDAYSGAEWDENPNQAGTHALVIIGCSDRDPDPANHYWLALNSWGTSGGVRPNGLIRIPMRIRYENIFRDSNNDRSYWGCGFETLAVRFDNEPLSVEPADTGPRGRDRQRSFRLKVPSSPGLTARR